MCGGAAKGSIMGEGWERDGDVVVVVVVRRHSRKTGRAGLADLELRCSGLNLAGGWLVGNMQWQHSITWLGRQAGREGRKSKGRARGRRPNIWSDLRTRMANPSLSEAGYSPGITTCHLARKG